MAAGHGSSENRERVTGRSHPLGGRERQRTGATLKGNARRSGNRWRVTRSSRRGSGFAHTSGPQGTGRWERRNERGGQPDEIRQSTGENGRREETSAGATRAGGDQHVINHPAAGQRGPRHERETDIHERERSRVDQIARREVVLTGRFSAGAEAPGPARPRTTRGPRGPVACAPGRCRVRLPAHAHVHPGRPGRPGRPGARGRFAPELTAFPAPVRTSACTPRSAPGHGQGVAQGGPQCGADGLPSVRTVRRQRARAPGVRRQENRALQDPPADPRR